MQNILLLAVLLINAGTLSCMHRAPSLKMLEMRAGYEDDIKEKELKLIGNNSLQELKSGLPERTKPKVAHIWIYPHETPQKEFFWGGWITIVIEGDKWEISKPNDSEPQQPKQE